jgi:hypothetical protein
MDTKKLIRQIQKDPKMFQMVKNIQNNANSINDGDSALTPSERLHAKMNALKGKRTSNHSKEVNKSKKLEQEKEKLQKRLEEEKKNFNAEKILQSEVSNISKTKRQHLKKLQKKYGKVTEDAYVEALEVLNDESHPKDEVYNKSRNIVNVYLSQQKNIDLNIVKTIDFNDE